MKLKSPKMGLFNFIFLVAEHARRQVLKNFFSSEITEATAKNSFGSINHTNHKSRGCATARVDVWCTTRLV
jgi:hypothetical protein